MATFRDTLTKLFTRNVVIKRLPGNRLKTLDVNKSQSAGSPTTYSNRARWRNGRSFNSVSGYGSGFTNEEMEALRQQMYMDYELMDTDSIISSALDITADESTTQSIDGQLLVIKTDDAQLKKVLNNLFYDILNIEFNLWSWIRTTCKYGDSFLHLQIAEEFGVVNVMPIHPSLMVREEGTETNIDQVRFRYEGDAGFSYSPRSYFEQFEIAHFRLLTDTNFLPYGRSYIEPARKEYKRLLLMEDSMLINRIMRAPERRLFKIDIGNIAPEEVDAYMEQITQEMKKVPYIDPATGDYNLKFNLMNSIEDFYMPVRGGDTGTSIETLDGLENAGQKDDVEYFKNKMIAALKIPKEYLGYGDDGGAGGGKCLHPNTMIPLLDGRSLPIKEIAELFDINKNQNLWVYSFDFKSNRTIPVKIKISEKTRLDAQLIRIHLDNDTFIDCTPDHNFIFKDGTTIEAQFLKEGDSLCAIYRRFQKMRKNAKYEQIYQPDTNKWEWTHSVVDEYFNGKIINNGYSAEGKFDRNDLLVRHHKDFTKTNNNPDNLQRITQIEHCKLHSEHADKTIFSEESKRKNKEIHQTPEFREKRSIAQKRRIQDNPELGLTLKNAWLSKTHEERSEIVKRGRTKETLKKLSDSAKRNEFYKKGQTRIKELFPNGRTDLRGSNNCRWVTRPEFDDILKFISTYEGDLNKINTWKVFCRKFGMGSNVVRDVINANGYSINQFLNQYIGTTEGRPKDYHIDYINEFAVGCNNFEELSNKLNISSKTLKMKILNQVDNFETWKSLNLSKCYNHKVVRVEFLLERSDTYNLEVDDENHNYLIENGIVIKNSNLATVDIRFARTIERIQKIIVSELYKVAIVHLYIQGFKNEDLLNFELYLTNPSLVFERQKTDVLTAKVDLVKSIKEDNLFSDKYIYENIFGMSEDEWKAEQDQIIESAKFKFRTTQIVEEGNDPETSGKSFGTPWDIATLQMAGKNGVGNSEDMKKLYTPDGREENEGKPPQYKGSFETKRDQDFGRDPMGRRENDKMEIPKPSMESVNRLIKNLDIYRKKDKKVLREENISMLNEDKILEIE